MKTPVLHLLAGSNGSGKSTFAQHVLLPVTGLPFVNADLIAERVWPDDRAAQEAHGWDASVLAEAARDRLLTRGASFVTETVFSHPSKLALITQTQDRGYTVELHVLLVPEDLTVARVADRAAAGGHTVPEDKIRSRYERLWALVAKARSLADRAEFYDNSSRSAPFRLVAEYSFGRPVGTPAWPTWTPSALRAEQPRP